MRYTFIKTGYLTNYPLKMMKQNFKFQQDIKKNIPWKIAQSDKSINLERPTGDKLSEDFEIKKSVSNIIKWNSCIDETKIKITVENGWVTLDGKVDLQFKRTKAELLAKDILGVTGVTNRIIIDSELYT